MALVIAGRIVPLDRADPDAVFKGRVFIDTSGTVERVTKGAEPAPSGYGAVSIIDVGDALVLPGLIDLHNHIGYNTLPLWTEPKQKVAFAHHDSWTRAATYQARISWPAQALAKAAPEALLAHVQLRALVGGTTAIQGWPAANRRSAQVLRNIDDEAVGGTGRNLIRTSALTKKPLELAKIAQEQKQGAGFIYHCAEGQAGSLVAREFLDAANAGCLVNTFIGIHCNAIPAAEWQRWSKNKAGAVVWSPFSNLWLYGSTTNIGAATNQDVAICLGSDWGPSGTKNVQGEIKVAKLANQQLGLGLSDRDLVAMVTSNPGDALARCWKQSIGRLSPGAFGDVTVFRANGGNGVWTRVVESTEDDVMLVVYDGIPRYGDAGLMSGFRRAPNEPPLKSSPITIQSRKRRFALDDPNDSAKVWSWKGITSKLNAVHKNPEKALKEAARRRDAYAGPLDASDAPLELVLDMPAGATPIAGDIMDHASEIEVPAPPSLVHDPAFFKAIKGRGFHAGVLDGLAKFYQ